MAVADHVAAMKASDIVRSITSDAGWPFVPTAADQAVINAAIEKLRPSGGEFSFHGVTYILIPHFIGFDDPCDDWTDHEACDEYI